MPHQATLSAAQLAQVCQQVFGPRLLGDISYLSRHSSCKALIDELVTVTGATYGAIGANIDLSKTSIDRYIQTPGRDNMQLFMTGLRPFVEKTVAEKLLAPGTLQPAFRLAPFSREEGRTLFLHTRMKGVYAKNLMQQTGYSELTVSNFFNKPEAVGYLRRCALMRLIGIADDDALAGVLNDTPKKNSVKDFHLCARALREHSHLEVNEAYVDQAGKPIFNTAQSIYSFECGGNPYLAKQKSIALALGHASPDALVAEGTKLLDLDLNAVRESLLYYRECLSQRAKYTDDIVQMPESDHRTDLLVARDRVRHDNGTPLGLPRTAFAREMSVSIKSALQHFLFGDLPTHNAGGGIRNTQPPSTYWLQEYGRLLSGNAELTIFDLEATGRELLTLKSKEEQKNSAFRLRDLFEQGAGMAKNGFTTRITHFRATGPRNGPSSERE